MSEALDSIIDRIDARELQPRSHVVVRRLADDLPELSPVGAEVVTAFDQGRSIGNGELIARLWHEIDSVPLDQQGAHRLLAALVHPDAAIDGYDAGYLISWSQQQGVPPESIVSAFD